MSERADAIGRSAATAAAWWAGRLRDGAGIGRNGDDSIRGVMAEGMIGLIRKKAPPTEENCDRFEDLLRERIIAILHTDGSGARCYWDNNGWDNGGTDLCLRVDYHPDEVLLAALSDAGVDRNVAEIAALPLKTTMRVSARRVMLVAGYGAQWKEIDGPRWGCSREEHDRVESVRSQATNDAWEAWTAAGRVGALGDWSGPVQQLASKPGSGT